MSCAGPRCAGWLYDEDGYPSGAVGGAVLADRPEALGASWAWLPLDRGDRPLAGRGHGQPGRAIDTVHR